MNQLKPHYNIKLLVFGHIRQYYNNGFIVFHLPMGSEIDTIKRALLDDVIQKHPHVDKTNFEELLKSCAFAFNDHFIQNFVVSDDCELAILPPACGG